VVPAAARRRRSRARVLVARDAPEPDADRAGGGRLRTTHGPILRCGGSDLDVGSIRGFFAESTSTRGKRGRVTVTWSVCADVENNPRQALLKVTSEDEARFLSRALSEQLGVPLTTNE
jgi:hypothetical protein